MNKILIGGVIVAVAVGAYFIFKGDAPEVATEAASTAAGAASDAATAATEAASEAATAATEAASDAAAATSAAASDAATAATDMVEVGLDQLDGLIDGSTLDDATKTTLKALVGQAKADPTMTEKVIADVKKALGM